MNNLRILSDKFNLVLNWDDTNVLRYLKTKAVIVYDKELYENLRKQGKIKKATGLERDNIIKQANGDLTECKRIQLERYFKE